MMEEASFVALVVRLATGAYISMGLIEDPVSGEKKKDLEVARITIETLDMLKEKTKGNLTTEEAGFLEETLADLKLKFVKAKEEK